MAYHRQAFTHCQTAGCGRETRDAKPHCPDHLGAIPYVRAVRAQLAAYKQEAECLSADPPGRLDQSGLIAREVIAHVVRMPMTISRLKLELRSAAKLSAPTVERVVRAMERAGRIHITGCVRDGAMVVLA